MHELDQNLITLKKLLTCKCINLICDFIIRANPSTLQADISQHGLAFRSISLLQEGHPVAYASRSFTKIEDTILK